MAKRISTLPNRDGYTVFDVTLVAPFEHGTQIFAMTEDIAERARKIGGTTIRSVGDISKYQRLKDNNAERVATEDMLSELRADNNGLSETCVPRTSV